MDPILIRNFAIALFIGALVGLEREKKEAPEAEHRLGGVRTFTLFALVGAVSSWLGQVTGAPWLFLGTVLAVSALVLAGYLGLVARRAHASGLTTEVAAIAVTLLGGVALYGQPELAVALGIVVSALLAFKRPLHRMVDAIGEDDLYAGLKLLIATFIVLPLLPHRALDPLGALNPATLWLLVILISAISLLGYVAIRLWGTGRGTALTGALGGLVSSTAVTLSLARRSRDEAASGNALLPTALAGGILLAWSIMFFRVIVLAAVIAPDLALHLTVPFLLLGIFTAVAGGIATHRGGRLVPAEPVRLKNPFSLTAAIRIALIFALVLFLVKLVERTFPAGGLYALAGLAGLTDMDAISLSMAQSVKGGQAIDTAFRAILLAAMSNTAAKAGLVLWLADRSLRTRILWATAGILLASSGFLVLG